MKKCFPLMRLICALLVVAAPGAGVHAADPAPVPAMKARLAAKVALTGLVRAGDALVATGAYGTVVRSTDNGQTWQQAEVPVSTLLTALHFVDAERGWAVGHGGVVLATTDGGAKWTLQQQLADKPVLLSVHFVSAEKGFAVGAYGSAWRTVDGGRNWSPMVVGSGRDTDMHLNHIFATRNGTLFVEAEFGLAFRSTDGGDSWRPLTTGVSGSLWSGLEGANGEIVLLGMSGRVLVSTNGGDSFQVFEHESGQSLAGAIVDVKGRLIVVGSGGLVLRGGERFETEMRADRQNLAAVALAADGGLIVAGQLGVERVGSGN
jgi:photosystem II stability/assembly factor-like uncharacterized protein